MEGGASIETAPELWASSMKARIRPLFKQENAAASAVDLTRTEPDEGENKDAKIRRLEAQVEAKDQKIRAMRNNINRNRQHEAGPGDDEMDGAN